MLIAQISDTHIALGNPETDAALECAVRHLMQLPAQPDLVLVTGDCVNNGTDAEYERFRELIRPLTMPVYLIPGNHDNRDGFLRAFGTQGDTPLDGFVQYVADDWPVRLIALDTLVPDQDGGNLCEARLHWLSERLSEEPEKPTILLMHHPPFRTGMTVFDNIGLANADAFGRIVARHPQVEAIVAGHVHSFLLRRFQGTVAMTCPPTTRSLFPDLGHPERLAVVKEPPACLLHVWRPASSLITYTSIIAEPSPLTLIHDGTGWVE